MPVDSPSIVTYEDALSFLFGQLPSNRRKSNQPVHRKSDLSLIRTFCDALGAPHLRYPVLHIAGTNGKGTLSHMMAAALQNNGLRTGLYTSPHYTDYRERIRIDGTKIPKSEILRFIQNHSALIRRLTPTFFEITAAMAFDYFARQKVDVAVIETGLGGRLDSTNIVSPLLSAITNIGMDHQAILGNTLEAIAREKAGVIKFGTPVIIGEPAPAITPVFEHCAAELEAPIVMADKHIGKLECSRIGEEIVYSFGGSRYLPAMDIQPDLYGPFVQVNLRTALAVLDVLVGQAQLDLNPVRAMEAFGQIKQITGYKGRWEVVGNTPKVIVDSAHNLHSIPTNMEYLAGIGYRRIHLVLGMVKDKGHLPVLRALPPDGQYYFVRPDVQRGMDAKALKQIAEQAGIRGVHFENMHTALATAIKNARPDDVIYIGGSTFVVADFLKLKECNYGFAKSS